MDSRVDAPAQGTHLLLFGRCEIVVLIPHGQLVHSGFVALADAEIDVDDSYSRGSTARGGQARARGPFRGQEVDAIGLVGAVDRAIPSCVAPGAATKEGNDGQEAGHAPEADTAGR
jgi:hypothetical protein